MNIVQKAFDPPTSRNNVHLFLFCTFPQKSVQGDLWNGSAYHGFNGLSQPLNGASPPICKFQWFLKSFSFNRELHPKQHRPGCFPQEIWCCPPLLTAHCPAKSLVGGSRFCILELINIILHSDRYFGIV